MQIIRLKCADAIVSGRAKTTSPDSHRSEHVASRIGARCKCLARLTGAATRLVVGVIIQTVGCRLVAVGRELVHVVRSLNWRGRADVRKRLRV